MKALLVSTGILLAMFLQGCSTSETATPAVIGMANPADVYCNDIGGMIKTMKEADGWYSICVLPDGTERESWELYRETHPSK
jgi:putative hemolysin